MDEPKHRVDISVIGEMRRYLDAAILRVGYRHPEWDPHLTDLGVQVEIENPGKANDVRREVLYAIYQERILADTMEMRRRLFELVTPNCRTATAVTS